MRKFTNSHRKSIIILSVGAWIRAQREGDIKSTLASKIVDNGYSLNGACTLSKRIINALKDEDAIHITKSGQLTLKRKLDAEYISGLCDRMFKKSGPSKSVQTLPDQKIDLKSFSDQELVSELRSRGWDIVCRKTQVIEIWHAIWLLEFTTKMVNSGFITFWNQMSFIQIKQFGFIMMVRLIQLNWPASLIRRECLHCVFFLKLIELIMRLWVVYANRFPNMFISIFEWTITNTTQIFRYSRNTFKDTATL